MLPASSLTTLPVASRSISQLLTCRSVSGCMHGVQVVMGDSAGGDGRGGAGGQLLGSAGCRVCTQRDAEGGAKELWTTTRCLQCCSICVTFVCWTHASSRSSDQTVAADATRDAWLEAHAISVELNPGAAMCAVRQYLSILNTDSTTLTALLLQLMCFCCNQGALCFWCRGCLAFRCASVAFFRTKCI